MIEYNYLRLSSSPCTFQKETLRHDRLRAAQDDPDALEALERATSREAKDVALPKTPSKTQHEPTSMAATPSPVEKSTKKVRRPRKPASNSSGSVPQLTASNDATDDVASSSAAVQDGQKPSQSAIRETVKDIKVEQRDTKDLHSLKRQHQQADVGAEMTMDAIVKMEQPNIKQEPMAATPEPDSRSTTPSGPIRVSGQPSPGKVYSEEPNHTTPTASPVATCLRSPSVTVNA